ncbi:MAG TPA: nucleotidyltransferase domain-containing protein [Planctomycetota bacterium]|nr:nucleotidyltransferase domain-containing protein [Planctomycetota bacterium]
MVKTKKMSVKAQIREMVKLIVKQFHPEKIILFGSQAQGDAGPDSDVDLLVVMPVEKGAKFKKMVEIGVALHDIPVPTDVIVTAPEDFEWRSKAVGTIEYPAAKEGKVLYERREIPAVVAAEWVEKAEEDLKNASHTLKLGFPWKTGCLSPVSVSPVSAAPRLARIVGAMDALRK